MQMEAGGKGDAIPLSPLSPPGMMHRTKEEEEEGKFSRGASPVPLLPPRPAHRRASERASEPANAQRPQNVKSLRRAERIPNSLGADLARTGRKGKERKGSPKRVEEADEMSRKRNHARDLFLARASYS